jgi:hypothetical protein
MLLQIKSHCPMLTDLHTAPKISCRPLFPKAHLHHSFTLNNHHRSSSIYPNIFYTTSPLAIACTKRELSLPLPLRLSPSRAILSHLLLPSKNQPILVLGFQFSHLLLPFWFWPPNEAVAVKDSCPIGLKINYRALSLSLSLDPYDNLSNRLPGRNKSRTI